MHVLRFWLLSLLLSLTGLVGCGSCDPDPGPDAGEPDAGPSPGLDGGPFGNDGGVILDASNPTDAAEPVLCDQNTEGWGDPCAAQAGDPLCGQFYCCTPENPLCEEGQLLFCYDLGPNECGGCEDLDTSEGAVGDTCGEYGCGTIVCTEDGDATLCEGDHPRNQCDGCSEIPIDAGVGDICSECMTGVQTCTRDQNDLVCWGGRSSANQCGTCDRCVLYHAVMDERFGGGYIRSGTIAIIEDIGDFALQLVFDPLVEGPGANGLPRAQILLSNTEDPFDGFSLPINPYFAESLTGTLADPVRTYNLSTTTNFDFYNQIVIYDYFLGEVISHGVLVPGAPPVIAEEDGGVVDAGEAEDAGETEDAGVDEDAGVTEDAGVDEDAGGAEDAGVVDAGESEDAGLTGSDAGLPDAGEADAGVDLDAGVAMDAGSLDAGSGAATDAGASMDSGQLDAGSQDGGLVSHDSGSLDAGDGG